MINNLWFYKASKSQTRALVDELMIYLELEDKILDSHYKYASDIKGVKPDENWVANEVIIDDDYDTTSNKKDTKKDNDKDIVDQNKCEHQYAVYDDSDAAGCEKTGTVTYKCLKCKKEYQKQTEALGHNYLNGVCTRCGKEDPSHKKPVNNVDDDKTSNDVTNTTTGDKTEHTQHNYTEIVSRKEATCTENGSVVKKCNACDKTTTEKLPAKGHSYGDWQTVTEATTEVAGLKKRICSICNNEETETIPKKPEPVTPTPGEDESKDPPIENGEKKEQNKAR